MRSEFEKHFLSLKFATGTYGKLILDSCTFDPYQDGYLPNVKSNVNECILYCCMLNTAYLSFKQQQSKVDELQKQRDSFIKAYEIEVDNGVDLQLRIDALSLALDKIAYPVPHMQKEADLNGCELNGYWAVKMSEDHTYSKDIARKALEKEQAFKGGGK